MKTFGFIVSGFVLILIAFLIFDVFERTKDAGKEEKAISAFEKLQKRGLRSGAMLVMRDGQKILVKDAYAIAVLVVFLDRSGACKKVTWNEKMIRLMESEVTAIFGPEYENYDQIKKEITDPCKLKTALWGGFFIW